MVMLNLGQVVIARNGVVLHFEYGDRKFIAGFGGQGWLRDSISVFPCIATERRAHFRFPNRRPTRTLSLWPQAERA
jgi:hypothetical protein